MRWGEGKGRGKGRKKGKGEGGRSKVRRKNGEVERDEVEG